MTALRNAIVAMLALGSAIAPVPAAAQSQPLRIIVGFPPGAGADLISRVVGEKMQASLGRTVIVENRPGGGGILANETVKNAAPDGNTILMTPFATMVAYPYSYSKLSYDPFKDYAPVAHLASFQLAFGIGDAVPAKTLAEYVALAKQDNKYRNFASAAAGSLPHFFGVMFARTAGIEMIHVPYRGTAPALQALVGGEIPAAMVTLADIGELARSGKARVLANSGGARAPSFPNVPTFKESGYDIEGTAWYAMFAPAGTPANLLAPLTKAAADAVKMADVQKRLADMGLEPTGYDAARLAAIMKADYDKWGPPIKASGFKAD